LAVFGERPLEIVALLQLARALGVVVVRLVLRAAQMDAVLPVVGVLLDGLGEILDRLVPVADASLVLPLPEGARRRASRQKDRYGEKTCESACHRCLLLLSAYRDDLPSAAVQVFQSYRFHADLHDAILTQHRIPFARVNGNPRPLRLKDRDL